MNASVSAGKTAFLFLRKGARMPSTAEDVRADMRSAALPVVGDLR